LSVPLTDLLPTATPAAGTDELRRHAGELWEEVASSADRATLLLLTSLLARLSGR
jgi:hypothetical protein